jgi:lipid-A-disaccharide synthase
MMVAGEASGDKHGAALALALRNLPTPGDLQLFGAGGDEMRAAGVDTLVDSRQLGIIGLPEIARALPQFYRAYKKLVAAALEHRPSAVVLIDWPDFNLRLARRLHQRGLKIVYYISPQIWAWRKYRIRAIRRSVERMLVILPFEEDFYRREGVAAEYVGHPLSGTVRVTCSLEEFASRHSLDPDRPIIALLPGSRHKELHYHLPVMARAAGCLRDSKLDWALLSSHKDWSGTAEEPTQGCVRPQQSPPRETSAPREAGGRAIGGQDIGPQFVVPLASTIDSSEARTLLGPDSDTIKIIERDTYNALGHAVGAVVASGTATVEAALLGVPMVIIYRGSEINWRLIRPLIKLDTFGMVNLIAGSRIVPELIQHKATPERIAGELISILSDQARLTQMKKNLALVKSRLISEGAAPPDAAARRVLDIALRGGNG